MNRETEFRGKRVTVREAAKQRKPLDGTDAQALEGALQQVERELANALNALRIMVRTYPYNPPCFNWKQQVYAHNKSQAVLSIHDTEEPAK